MKMNYTRRTREPEILHESIAKCKDVTNTSPCLSDGTIIVIGPIFGQKRPIKTKKMPAKSEKQRRLMGAALAYKRGENKHPSREVIHVAESMNEKELVEMAKKPRSKKETK